MYKNRISDSYIILAYNCLMALQEPSIKYLFLSGAITVL